MIPLRGEAIQARGSALRIQLMLAIAGMIFPSLPERKSALATR